MFILVPGYFVDEQAKHLFFSMIERLRRYANATLILISQGERVSVEAGKGLLIVHQEHFSQPIGKWAAIRKGLALVAAEREARILLIDDDDPIDDQSVFEVCEALRQDQGDYLIGERSQINLSSDGKTNDSTRVLVELVGNALTLLATNGKLSTSEPGPDIQSGVFVLSARARRSLDLCYVRDYGGELGMYFELARAGYDSKALSIRTNEATPSSYSVPRVVRSIVSLPFLSNVTTGLIDEALIAAPLLYSRFMSGEADATCLNEIRELFHAAVAERLAANSGHSTDSSDPKSNAKFRNSP